MVPDKVALVKYQDPGSLFLLKKNYCSYCYNDITEEWSSNPETIKNLIYSKHSLKFLTSSNFVQWSEQ